jgi:hypothetical protein
MTSENPTVLPGNRSQTLPAALLAEQLQMSLRLRVDVANSHIRSSSGIGTAVFQRADIRREITPWICYRE